MPEILSAYDKRPRPRIKTGKGQTQQHFKDECDINNIMRRFAAGAEITHLARVTPRYGEAPAQSFAEAMFLVKDTEREFNALPSEIRKEFMNDASLYLDAISDPDKADRLRELGILPQLPAASPDDNTVSAAPTTGEALTGDSVPSESGSEGT